MKKDCYIDLRLRLFTDDGQPLVMIKGTGGEQVTGSGDFEVLLNEKDTNMCSLNEGQIPGLLYWEDAEIK